MGKSKFVYVEVPSKAAHTWIEEQEVYPHGPTYVQYVGMIQPTFEGYLATSCQSNGDTFTNFADAKAFIIKEAKELRVNLT